MDAADLSASDGVMIAFLPMSTDWCQIELPHMTLVYAGTKSDLKPSDYNALAKDAASLAALASPFWLRVVATEVLGTDDPVKVFRLQPTTELWAMRRYVERWNKSEHPFSPHVTIGPAVNSFTREVPPTIGFDRVYFGWGDEKESLTFKMTRGSSSVY